MASYLPKIDDYRRTFSAAGFAVALVGLQFWVQSSCIQSLPANNIPTNVAVVLLQRQTSTTSTSSPGVSITPSGGALLVSELGTTDTLAIVLNSQPTAAVTVQISFDSTQILVNGSAVSPQTLSFGRTCPNPDCWSVSQTLTISAVDDASLEATPHTSALNFSTSSTDSDYNNLSLSSVNAQITDNDTPGVAIVETSGSSAATEGGTDTYTIALTSSPTANVQVTVASSNAANAEVNGGASVVLNFDNVCPGANCWSTPQTVTISALDDAVAEGAHSSVISHTLVSGDGSYNGMAVPNVNFGITDNDTAGISLVESGGTTAMTEGAVDTYTIVLTSEPTANVQITVNADAQTRVNGGASAALNFDAACPGANCWSTPQTINVTGFDDFIVEGNHSGTVTHVNAVSADANYSGRTTPNVSVSITDNDSAGVTVTESGGNTNVTEGATPPYDTYDLVLTSEPTANVTITVWADAQSQVRGGSCVAVLAASCTFTFTSGTWNVAQTVDVAAINDDIVEGAHNATITHSAASGDGNYGGIGIANVTAAITDNDSAGITVTESGGNTAVTEIGATDSYTVVLTSQPTANVSVSVAFDNTQLTVNGSSSSPQTLTFTAGLCPGPGNWCTAQTVTVAAVDDHVLEAATHNNTITQTASSGDGNYNAIAVADPSVAITDRGSGKMTVTNIAGTPTAFYTSLAVDGMDPNKIYIAYFNDDNNTLQLARTADGGTTWTPSTVDDGSAGTVDVGRYCRVKSLGGYVYISYYDNTNKDLKLAISSDSGATFAIQTVASVGDTGSYSDLEIEGAIPALRNIYISTRNATANAIAVQYSNDNGSSWLVKTVHALQSPTTTAIAADGGRVITGFFENNNDEWIVKYINDITVNPAFLAGAPNPLDTQATFPEPADMDFDPVLTKAFMCYYTGDAATLNLASSFNNALNWDIQTVDSSGDVGDYCSVRADGPDWVYITYYDKATFDLNIAFSSTNDGNKPDGWTIKTIDSTGQTGLATSVFALGGATAKVWVSYVDLTNKTVRFAKSIDNAATW
ncbi:MAG: hypothetical protein KDK39_12690 [Leptospiraceae bacterium]|nr:hypothetical protein [Leptospiraceae bacterium]